MWRMSWTKEARLPALDANLKMRSESSPEAEHISYGGEIRAIPVRSNADGNDVDG
jgi:hypothetical protein